MRKPILSPRVLDGLRSMAAQIGAGSSDDFMGYPEDQMDREQKRDWENVGKACDWISSMAIYQKGKEGAK